MLAIIDADIVAYRCAAASENDPVEIAILRADKSMREILNATRASSYLAFLGGDTNFRKDLYPLYKAHRPDKKPVHLVSVQEFLITEWNTLVAHGQEADDEIGIAATEQFEHRDGYVDLNYTICSIDKDLLQIPGRHYNFVKMSTTEVSPMDARLNFYKQLLLGDKTDNVPGYDGMLRQKPTKAIEAYYREMENLTSESELWEFVYDLYQDKEQCALNGKLLWIRRKPDQLWNPPLISEQSQEAKSSSTSNIEKELTQSTELTSQEKNGFPVLGHQTDFFETTENGAP